MHPLERFSIAARYRTLQDMQQILSLAAKARMSFASNRMFDKAAAPCDTPAQPLMVLRGVSLRETVRSRAAKVIAVTALHFDVWNR